MHIAPVTASNTGGSPSPMKQLLGTSHHNHSSDDEQARRALFGDAMVEPEEEDDLLVDPITAPAKPPQPLWKHFHDSKWGEHRSSSPEQQNNNSTSSPKNSQNLSPFDKKKIIPSLGPMQPPPYQPGVTVQMIQELQALPSARDTRVPFQKQSLDHPELNVGHHEISPMIQLGVEMSETLDAT